MNYLVCMLLIGLTVAFFLYILSRIESGRWETVDFKGPHSVLRELFVRSRA